MDDYCVARCKNGIIKQVQLVLKFLSIEAVDIFYPVEDREWTLYNVPLE